MLLWATPGPLNLTRNKKPKTMKMSGGSSMGYVCACMLLFLPAFHVTYPKGSDNGAQ